MRVNSRMNHLMYKMIGCRSRSVCVISILFFLSQFAALAAPARAQGFGLTRRTVKLQQKMTALVHLPGPGFEVEVRAHDAGDAALARTLSDMLTNDLQKYGRNLQVKPSSPDEVIRCTIGTFQIPPPVPYVRNEMVLQKGKGVEEPVQYYKVTGAVSVSYQAQDGAGKILDSDTVTAKYSQEFQVGANPAAGQSLESKVTDPFKRLAGRDTQESYEPTTPDELRQILLSRASSQIASRLVNTDDTLEIPLASGRMEEADNLATEGLWQRDLEALSAMTPLPREADDAYRLYNIGVAYEALAYQSRDTSAREKYLEKAAINYSKAINANPGEKLFAEPQNRIEVAVAHYKRLQGPRDITR